MGQQCSRVCQMINNKPESTILVVTHNLVHSPTILQRIKSRFHASHLIDGEYDEDKLIYEEFLLRNVNLSGEFYQQSPWRSFQNVEGVIFVIDSSDVEEINMTKRRIKQIFESSNMNNVRILILTNNGDDNYSLGFDLLKNALGLERVPRQIWRLFPLIEDEFVDDITWLFDAIRSKRKFSS